MILTTDEYYQFVGTVKQVSTKLSFDNIEMVNEGAPIQKKRSVHVSVMRHAIMAQLDKYDKRSTKEKIVAKR